MSESSQSTNVASSKRPREDNTDAGRSTQANKARGNATERVRDEEFWYEDGTIILVARNVEFRVYKGVLADHSSVFADMISLPQPTSSSSSPAHVDCPLIYLEESPEDLRHILRALFPKKSATFIHLDAEPHTFHMISAYVRLGHKYHIDTLFDQSLSHLKGCFTTDFDARQKWLTKNWQGVPVEWGSYEARVYAIGVVNLARLAQCVTILPSALEACCSLKVEELFDGFLRQDGTRERLSEKDLKLCIAGMRALTHAGSAAVIEALVGFSRDECKTREVCQGTIQLLISDHTDDVMGFPAGTGSPFENWEDYMSLFLKGACRGCAMNVKKRFHAQQRSLWAKLPSIFGITIEGWPTNGA
ncbi:hypothetical protein C8T65DRAFT_809535 [Cerioporus squamosus]|nr:hypothetical protein C8T65DRAFT_809535 [Cerioporus squamosus]